MGVKKMILLALASMRTIKTMNLEWSAFPFLRPWSSINKAMTSKNSKTHKKRAVKIISELVQISNRPRDNKIVLYRSSSKDRNLKRNHFFCLNSGWLLWWGYSWTKRMLLYFASSLNTVVLILDLWNHTKRNSVICSSSKSKLVGMWSQS